MHTLTLSSGKSKSVYIGGWKRQKRDPRDDAFKIKSHRAMLGAVQTKCDNRGFCSPVEDQADIGSCTANAFAALVEANQLRAGYRQALFATPTVVVAAPVVDANGVITFQTTVTPAVAPTPAPVLKVFTDVSRLLHYYATRRIMGTTSEDSGAYIRDTIKAGNKYGIADEKLWPYVPSKFATNPPKTVWTEAAKHKVTSYHPITDGDIETMKATLLLGYLIEFGFEVYDAMLSDKVAKTGMLCPPGPKETPQGGHAVALVGFDDSMVMPDGSKGAFLVRNSWGTAWGLKGYFWMGYNYVGNTALCNDFWVVQSQPL
jgi:C1A family cysteine protease